MGSVKIGDEIPQKQEGYIMDETGNPIDDAENLEVAEQLNLKDEDELLRLLFDSESYSNGEILDEAIKTRDLKINGYSLDIKSISRIEVIEDRANNQAQNILVKSPDSDKRKVPYISTLLNSDLNSCVDENGHKLFETIHTPQPENYAHVSLYCILKDQGKQYYVYARNQIRPLLERTIISLKDYKRTI